MQLSRRSFFGLFPLSACAVSVAASLKPSPPAPVDSLEFEWAEYDYEPSYTDKAVADAWLKAFKSAPEDNIFETVVTRL